jgi:hypothetical protein
MRADPSVKGFLIMSTKSRQIQMFRINERKIKNVSQNLPNVKSCSRLFNLLYPFGY